MNESPVIKSQLKICEFNLENLFISLDYHEGQEVLDLTEEEWRELALPQLRRKQKPLAKTLALAKAVLDINADVLMLVEVGGEDSLRNFNHHFLSETYVPHFLEGNAGRGIDLGFLVRRNLGLHARAHSNRETPIEVNTFTGRFASKFSRDVAELHLRDDQQLRLILLLTHLKSKISTEQDYQGKDMRTAEAMALTTLYQERRSAFPEVPIVLGGDFNASLLSLEMEILKRTDLTDFHDILGTPFEERTSLVHFDFMGNPHPQVLDHLLVSPHLKNRIVPAESGVHRFRGFYELPEPLPESPRERHQMPSDHYPLVLTLQL